MAFNSVFSWFMKKRLHQMELFMRYPLEAQLEVFEQLLEAGRHTAYGRTHGFDKIRSRSDYRRQVPLQSYEDVKPWVQRLKAGEQGLLWPTEINWFAMSSGTTNDRSKFIPVSREALENCHYKAGKDLLAVYTQNHQQNRLYSGKSLVLGGSSQINQLRKDSYYGDLSAIIINNLPIWVELKRVPDRSIALMDRWEEKIEQMARSVVREDVTSMAGVPSWTLVLLRRVLELTGSNHIPEVWPNLELYMHGGVSFEPYRSQYQQLIPGSQLNYYECYNASEGFFGIQDRPGADDMLLMLDYGIYYEFVPLELSQDANPPSIDLSDVRPGVPYEMIITTNAGLWRYRLGDVVTFTSTAPFRIRVSGRTKNFINAFGEELMIDNAEMALAEACSRHHCQVEEYTAAPVYMEAGIQGAHQWLIEFKVAPVSLEAFTETLDQELRRINSDYDAKRTGNLTLRLPTVQSMPPGTFYSWLKAKDKLGGQHKVPRLCNHRRLIEEILALSPAA